MKFLAEIREGLGISWDALRANKMRSVLATLGIVIGIVTVTLMGAAINGLNQAFIKTISALGADVFYVSRFKWFNNSYEDWLNMRKRPHDHARGSGRSGPTTDACRRRRARPRTTRIR